LSTEGEANYLEKKEICEEKRQVIKEEYHKLLVGDTIRKSLNINKF